MNQNCTNFCNELYEGLLEIYNNLDDIKIVKFNDYQNRYALTIKDSNTIIFSETINRWEPEDVIGNLIKEINELFDNKIPVTIKSY